MAAFLIIPRKNLSLQTKETEFFLHALYFTSLNFIIVSKRILLKVDVKKQLTFGLIFKSNFLIHCYCCLNCHFCFLYKRKSKGSWCQFKLIWDLHITGVPVKNGILWNIFVFSICFDLYLITPSEMSIRLRPNPNPYVCKLGPSSCCGMSKYFMKMPGYCKVLYTYWPCISCCSLLNSLFFWCNLITYVVFFV